MSSPLSPPRVCVLSKAGGREYGFHLHGEKGKHGQYVKSVDAGSPAEQSGLRPDDRVIEVNGINIERETHQQVVIRIKENPMEVRLLVVDQETDNYYKKQGVTVKESMAAVTTPVAADQTPEPPVENGVDHPEPAPEPAPVVSQAQPEEPPAQRVAVPPHLAPRLCHIAKGDSGYGFNLHGEKGHRGQFIRAIDAGSPAEVAGLKVQDRLVEVNGENIEALKHAEVVGKIKEGGNETTLLVVDKESDAFFQEKGIPITTEYVGGTPGVNGDPHPVVETPPPTPPAVEEPVSVTEVSSAPPVNSPVSSPDTSSPELPPPPTPEETPAPTVEIPHPPAEEPEPTPEPVANSTPEPQSAPSPASSPSEDSGVGDFTIDLATARQKVLSKKKARPSQMNWQNKHEIFNNM